MSIARKNEFGVFQTDALMHLAVSNMSKSAYRVLYLLMSIGDKHGNVYQTQSVLARGLKISRPMLSKAIKELERTGFITSIDGGVRFVKIDKTLARYRRAPDA